MTPLDFSEYKLNLYYYSGREVDHPRPPSTEVKERLKLYIYNPLLRSWCVR